MNRLIPPLIAAAAVVGLNACTGPLGAELQDDTATVRLSPGSIVIVVRSLDGRLSLYLDALDRPNHHRLERLPSRPSPSFHGEAILQSTSAASTDGSTLLPFDCGR